MGSLKKNWQKLHAVIIPFPAQGHVTPFLQLAKKLVVVLGFRITLVNTTHVHDRLMKSRSVTTTLPDHEGIEFVSMSDGLPEDHPRLRDLTAFCKATLKMGPTFEDLFLNLLKKSPITCVIRDILFPSVAQLAQKFTIPVVVFAIASAISTHCCYNVTTFISTGILPIPAPPEVSTPSISTKSLALALPQSDAEAAVRNASLTCLHGSSPTMRVKDIPTFIIAHDLEDFFIRYFLEHINPPLPDSACILYNTQLPTWRRRCSTP